MKNFGFQNFKGQSVVEYSLLLGVVIAVVVLLTPMIKRATQSMVRVVADELAEQQNAEPKTDGGLIYTNMKAAIDRQQGRQEWYSNTVHSVQTSYDDTVQTNTQSAADLGTSQN